MPLGPATIDRLPPLAAMIDPLRPLDREAGIALQHLPDQFRTFSRAPQAGGVSDPVPQGPAVRPLAAGHRPRDADELGSHFVA